MQAYDMKDSGVEWLGDIPEHWSCNPLKRYCQSTFTGKTPDTGVADYFSDDTGFKWFAPECFTSEKYLTFPKKLVTELAIQKNQAKIYPKNSVYFIGIGATTGKVAISDEESSANQQINILQTNFKMTPSFLYYHLKNIEAEVSSFAQYTTLPILNKTKTGYISVCRPSLGEQKSISNYLDKACEKIDKTLSIKKQQIDTLEAYRKSIIHEAVTNGLDKNVPVKDSGVECIGTVPSHWNISKAKYAVSKINSGSTPKGGSEGYVDDGIPLIRSQNVKNSGLDLSDVVFIPNTTHHKMSNSKVRSGDVLLNITGASIGRSAFVASIDEANVNQHVCILRAYPWLSPQYLQYILSCQVGQAQIYSSFTGSGREGLNFEAIKRFNIPLPKNVEQKAIANYLDKACEKINKSKAVIESQITKLTQYRQSLIHECVTGKKRVYQDDNN